MIYKLSKNNLLMFCAFATLLVFVAVHPAFAISNTKMTSPSLVSLPSNSSLNKQLPKTVTPKNACMCIIFRLDGVQGSSLSNVQMQIMDIFQKKNASLSIGVMGYGLPQGTQLVSYLKSNLKPGHASIEVANNGWNRENYASLSLSQQVLIMNKTNQELANVLGKKPNVFTPPNDMYDADTLKAIKQLKMNVISAAIWEEDKFVTTQGSLVTNKDSQGIYHMPSMTDFQIDNGDGTYWTSIPKGKILTSIDSHISKYGYDVFLLHPQNFATIVNETYSNTVNKAYLDELASIIDYVKSKHIQITTFSNVVSLDHTKPIASASKTTPVLKPVTPPTPKTDVEIPAYTPPEVNISKFLEATNPSKVISFVEQNGSITMNAKYPSGDRVGAQLISLKVYQDFSRIPYHEIKSVSDNPYTVTSLPMYHQYKIETYVGGMLSSSNLVTLDNQEQDLDVNIPESGSISVTVYYNDGQTPIPDAIVTVRSQDNKTRAGGTTDPDGIAPKFYLQSTTTYGNYYVVDGKINDHMTFSSTHMTLQPGDANNVKLVAPWPAVIQNLVTIKVYNQTKLLSLFDKTFAVDMYDDTGEKISESPINIHGEGYFWSMKTGDYTFKVVNTTNDKVLGTLSTTLDGTKNNFQIIMQNNPPAKLVQNKI